MDKISVLQIGGTVFSENYMLPEGAQLTYVNKWNDWPKDEVSADVVFVMRTLSEKEEKSLGKIAKAYTLFYDEQLPLTDSLKTLFTRKVATPISVNELGDFFQTKLPFYFHSPYGEKLGINLFGVAEGFKGKVSWVGNHRLVLEADFGDSLRQVSYWRSNIPLFHGMTLDVTLEYEHTPEVEISLRAVQFRSGTISDKVREWNFSESELKDIVRLYNPGEDGIIFYSIQARGKGTLKLGGIHERYSRQDIGFFIPGGERYVTSTGEEIFCYFDPGDCKPPLNVFFSGYKTKEGFEGFNLMRKKGKPFLLVSEARLEGGAFYLGSPEYEKMLGDTIRKYMRKLKFSSGDVIMSGISMGTFGAMYYACDLLPGAVVLGKPLFSLGNIAANEKLNRPGGFPTSVDLLLFLYGSTNEEAREKLNARFWDKFDRTNWSHTRFVISYMYEDDYDMDAYQTLLSHINRSGVSIYGKGLHGRHNDDTNGIVEWFNRQYDRLIEEYDQKQENQRQDNKR